jgi:hypothetical protein
MLGVGNVNQHGGRAVSHLLCFVIDSWLAAGRRPDATQHRRLLNYGLRARGSPVARERRAYPAHLAHVI